MIIRVRFHGRGGQAMKTAGRIVGTAAFLEGYRAQDSPMYGPERRGAPVASFLRISDEEIAERGYIWSPDLIAIADATLIDDPRANVLDGAREDTAAFVNSHGMRDVRVGWLRNVTSYDVTSAALNVIGRAVLSSGVAGSVARLLPISSGSLEEAVKVELDDIGLREKEIDLNVKLALECYQNTPPVAISSTNALMVQEFRNAPFGWMVPEVSMAIVTNLGNTTEKRTGNWRVSRPVIDYDRCTKCQVCYDYCPEAAISLGPHNEPVIDYDECKGCLICYNECPVKGAIRVIDEGKAREMEKAVA